jgi:hypothetical protein
MQNLQTRYVAIAMTTSPPITPPAMAPTFGDEPLDGVGVLEAIGAQIELAQY